MMQAPDGTTLPSSAEMSGELSGEDVAELPASAEAQAQDAGTTLTNTPPRNAEPTARGDALPWLVAVLTLSWLAHRAARALAGRLPVPRPPAPAVLEPAVLAVGLFLLGAVVGPYIVLGLGNAKADATDQLFVSMWVTATANLVAAGLAALYARNRQGLSLQSLGLSPRGGLSMYGFAAATLVSFAPIYLLAAILNGALLEVFESSRQQEVVESLLSEPGFRTNPVTVALICIVVPIGEEMIFRGYLQRALRSIFGPFAAIALAAGAFALVHDPAAMLPVFVVGLCLGLICERTGSIWPAALGHALFNTTQMMNVFLLAD